MSNTSVLTIAQAAAALRSGEVTATELTTTKFKLVAEIDSELGAFVTVCEETAMAAAEAADRDFAAGVDRSLLQGIPLVVKDIIATKDAPTTANSRVLDPAWGSGIDAPVVQRLRDAGAVLVGKTTTSEFACGLPDPTKGFPIPHNPWNLAHTASGSSSGTGIAVASGMAFGGLGTDTGGSVRAPAAASGHTGLKVTFGRVPKSGVVPLGYTLDSVGPMARSAYDCALLLEVMAGYDAGDPYASSMPIPKYTGQLDGNVTGLRIGVARGYFLDNPDLADDVRAGVEAVLADLQSAGAELVDVTIPYADEAGHANNATWVSEGFAYHRNDLVSRWSDYGASTRDVLGRGAFFTGADYNQAQRVRRVFRTEVARVFADIDVMITPFALKNTPRADQMNMGDLFSGVGFSGQWNLTGQPAVTIPCGFGTEGLPLSVQIVGKPFQEGTVLKVADAYQRATEWHLEVPPIARAA